MQLTTLQIVGQGPGPHLLITGGIHGDEFEAMSAIRRLRTEIDPQQLRGQVTLVPVVNEPAFSLGSRLAQDGIDLVRACPGKLDGTVTEVIAFHLTELIRSADLYIDLHSGGARLMVLPLCGYMLHPNEGVLESQRRMARMMGLPVIWGGSPNLDGRSLSVARDANVPAIYAEFEGGGRLNPQGTEAYARGCLNVMQEFGLLPGAPQILSTGPLIIEDGGAGTGHAQLTHFAPRAGFFEPCVRLGQRLQEGDPLGTVSDQLGTQVEVVRAKYAGIVIVLHTFPRVEAGVSVAVILETASSLDE